MKLLVATGIYPPEIGGPATYSKLLFDELPKRGFGVDVLSFGQVRKLPKIIRHAVFFFKLLRRSFSADVIFAQDTVSVGFPSLLVAKILRKKFFVRTPGDYAWEQSTQRYGVKESIDDFQNRKYSFKVEFLRKIQKMTVDGADVVISPSVYFRNLVSKWVKNPEKVFCIYNGIDLSVIPDKEKIFDHKTIISAGRLVSWKGFGVLIETLKFLPEWKLFIAGSGPLRRELESVALKNDVSARVFFLGQISRKDLIEKIQKCEVFVLNTSFESFSFQVVEAMASGTPVITTNIGNLSEIIDNNKEGILVAPDNKGAIVEGIKKLSSDSLFREKIISAAKERSKQFSIENTVNSLIKLLEKI